MNDVLLIMPDFFSTKENICNSLKFNGYNVISYSDRPSKSNLIKGLIRINRKFVYFRTKRYIKKIISENKDKFFERIIVINGQAFTKNHVRMLFSHLKYKESNFYMWDELAFLPYTEKLLPLFSSTITFNIEDYKNGKFKYFLPLFIPNEYANKLESKKTEYDICFIGTGKPEKIKTIKDAIKYCADNNLKGFFHVYLPSKMTYLFNKLFRKEYKGIHRDFFKFYKMDHDEIKDIYSKSLCVLDAGKPTEGGLALRIFEILGLEKKMILVNQSIENYKFYDSNQFCLLKNDFVIPSNFLVNEDINIDKEFYFVNNWIKYLINPEKIALSTILK